MKKIFKTFSPFFSAIFFPRNSTTFPSDFLHFPNHQNESSAPNRTELFFWITFFHQTNSKRNLKFISPHTKTKQKQNVLFPFSILSLCLSIFNLIPLVSLYGGRILKCALCLIFSLDTAEKILRITSFITLVSLWMLSVYMMLRISNGIPMFIFCLIFFSSCFVFNIKTRDFERIWEFKWVNVLFF